MTRIKKIIPTIIDRRIKYRKIILEKLNIFPGKRIYLRKKYLGFALLEKILFF
ncbi:hypothetical protein KKH36_02695 [Patescibacteria group bacterium]|nr:hypothetical protein [Patescibacteria group bacterium]